MKHAMCFLPNIPLRRTPEDGGEMLTELLFGDACLVYEYDKTWARIKNKADGYDGWLTTKMLTPMSEEEYNQYEPGEQSVISSYFAEAIHSQSGRHLLLTGGSVLPDYKPDGTFKVKEERYYIDPIHVDHPNSTILETAYKYLNSPYLWGGKNAMGIDCSGLTQVIYRIHGIQLLRNACDQVSQGELVPFLYEALPGDLAFFDHDDNVISHVGIVAEEGTIIHASGNVHIDRLDAEGIYSEERGFYTHKLRIIKRIIY